MEISRRPKKFFLFLVIFSLWTLFVFASELNSSQDEERSQNALKAKYRECLEIEDIDKRISCFRGLEALWKSSFNDSNAELFYPNRELGIALWKKYEASEDNKKNEMMLKEALARLQKSNQQASNAKALFYLKKISKKEQNIVPCKPPQIELLSPHSGLFVPPSFKEFRNNRPKGIGKDSKLHRPVRFIVRGEPIFEVRVNGKVVILVKNEKGYYYETDEAHGDRYDIPMKNSELTISVEDALGCSAEKKLNLNMRYRKEKGGMEVEVKDANTDQLIGDPNKREDLPDVETTNDRLPYYDFLGSQTGPVKPGRKEMGQKPGVR